MNNTQSIHARFKIIQNQITKEQNIILINELCSNKDAKTWDPFH